MAHCIYSSIIIFENERHNLLFPMQLAWVCGICLSIPPFPCFPLWSSLQVRRDSDCLWYTFLFSPSWRTTCLWAFSFSSATCKLSMCLIVVLRSPGLKMAWVLPLAGVFFCTQASGLVCTGRLLQNMLGIGCEFKGKELFCTRFLPETLLFCRKVCQYFACVAK